MVTESILNERPKRLNVTQTAATTLQHDSHQIQTNAYQSLSVVPEREKREKRKREERGKIIMRCT